MSQAQSWGDSPSTGAYQEHEVSSVFRQAVELMVWQPLADRLPIQSGQSVTIPIRGRLSEPTSTELSENVSIPLDKLTITAKTVDLVERGRGVMVTNKAMNRSPIALLEEHRMALAEQMALTMDKVVGDAAQTGQLKYAATGVASYNLATAGSFGAAALSNPNFFHIRKMRDLAFRTYLMPKRENGRYVYISSTAGIRGILDDPEFLEINKNGNQSIFQSNLAGTIADVEIREDNHVLSDGVGTNSDVGEGVFLAREALKLAILEMPSIHFDSSHDHGRFTSLAWYGDWACEPSTDSANAGLVRLIHFGSS